ncbi:hypothetical protein HMPREF0321_2242 [Dermacoccus sp. Ellin185]|nr:hypothetical protein HMPREF0321_2242 [Dermacoccus sp. Ellin185]
MHELAALELRPRSVCTVHPATSTPSELVTLRLRAVPRFLFATPSPVGVHLV